MEPVLEALICLVRVYCSIYCLKWESHVDNTLPNMPRNSMEHFTLPNTNRSSLFLFCSDLQLKAEILSHIGSLADVGENVPGSLDK